MGSRRVTLTDAQYHALIAAICVQDVTLEDRNEVRERQLLDRAATALNTGEPVPDPPAVTETRCCCFDGRPTTGDTRCEPCRSLNGAPHTSRVCSRPLLANARPCPPVVNDPAEVAALTRFLDPPTVDPDALARVRAFLDTRDARSLGWAVLTVGDATLDARDLHALVEAVEPRTEPAASTEPQEAAETGTGPQRLAWAHMTLGERLAHLRADHGIAFGEPFNLAHAQAHADYPADRPEPHGHQGSR